MTQRSVQAKQALYWQRPRNWQASRWQHADRYQEQLMGMPITVPKHTPAYFIWTNHDCQGVRARRLIGKRRGGGVRWRRDSPSTPSLFSTRSWSFLDDASKLRMMRPNLPAIASPKSLLLNPQSLRFKFPWSWTRSHQEKCTCPSINPTRLLGQLTSWR